MSAEELFATVTQGMTPDDGTTPPPSSADHVTEHPSPVGDVVDDLEHEVPDPGHPMAVARKWLDQHHTDDRGRRLLRHHRNTFWAYDGTAWPEVEERRLLADLYRWLEDRWYWKKTATGLARAPFHPTRRKMADLAEGLKAHTHLDQAVTPPAWLDGTDGEVIPLTNGLLHITTRELAPHTPDYFSPHVLPFAYDPGAPYPLRWLRFLEELWPDDVESSECLGELFGYVLGGGTSLQKIVALVGPKRSGKGTIGRVLTGLLGTHNVAAPTLSGLTTNFGLSPLIGRPLALISDARLGSRADSMVAVERLLSISGEDTITIDRKYRDPWTGRLPTRFMVLTNEIPRFTDSSGALASRFVILVLTRSFYGQEDPSLTDELLAERPGILNWALDGLDRLRSRGRFEQPASALAAVHRLEDLSSPVGAFVRDRCVIDAARHATKDSLWADWKDWCSTEGREHAGTKAVFMRDLSAAFPSLRTSRPKIGEKRVHVCEGIDLRRTEDPDDEPDGMLELQSTEPLTTPDQDLSGRGSGPNGSTGNRTSEGSVRGGQGSDALYGRPAPNRLTRGDVVRHDREPGRRFRFVQYRGDGSAHVQEIEFGEAVKSRFFRPGELALVEPAGEVADGA